jgi:hypothetical protein
MAWCTMWYRLVLAYQLDVWGSCDGRSTGMFDEVIWQNREKVWVKLQWLKPIRHKRGLLVGCDAHSGGETSVGMLQASRNH